MIERLEAIGYAAGTQAPATAGGVRRFDRARAHPGRNLMVSAHDAEVLLLDMEGMVLHRWAMSFEEAYPGVEPAAPAGFFRAAHALPDGRLLALYEGAGLVMLEADSTLLWASPLLAHHDVTVAGDAVYALTRSVEKREAVFGSKPFLEDFVSILDLSDGSERARVSLVDAVRAWKPGLLEESQGSYGDLLHTNSLQVLDGSAAAIDPAFAEGNVLVSIHALDMLAVLDPSVGRFLWAWRGEFDGQHDARQHSDGSVTLFDNQGAGDRSRVGRIDLRTGKLRWTHGLADEGRFFTPCCGTAQRLANGNVLVTESEFGRALELTATGGVVWEFVSPWRAGPNQEYVAVLFSLRRLPLGFGGSWLGSR